MISAFTQNSNSDEFEFRERGDVWGGGGAADNPVADVANGHGKCRAKKCSRSSCKAVELRVSSFQQKIKFMQAAGDRGRVLRYFYGPSGRTRISNPPRGTGAARFPH